MAQAIRKEIPLHMIVNPNPIINMGKTSQSLDIIDILRESSWSDFGEILIGFVVFYLLLILAAMYQ